MGFASGEASAACLWLVGGSHCRVPHRSRLCARRAPFSICSVDPYTLRGLEDGVVLLAVLSMLRNGAIDVADLHPLDNRDLRARSVHVVALLQATLAAEEENRRNRQK